MRNRLIISLLLLSGLAQADEWTGKDKKQHFAGSALMCVAASAASRRSGRSAPTCGTTRWPRRSSIRGRARSTSASCQRCASRSRCSRPSNRSNSRTKRTPGTSCARTSTASCLRSGTTGRRSSRASGRSFPRWPNSSNTSSARRG